MTTNVLSLAILPCDVAWYSW